jgi:leucyl aminopeptidase (aminopeptidase T)
MKTDKLRLAAENAVTQALRLKTGESFLLVTDTLKLPIAEAIARAAKAAGAETTTYLMTEALRPIQEPTKLFREITPRATAMLYMLEGRIAEKPFRGYMVGAGEKYGRVCMMPGITEDMMKRLVAIDFRVLAGFTRKVARALENADDVVVTNPAGTRIAFSVKGRPWRLDVGDISKKGMHGNLPAGECFTAPVESTFSGRLVIGLVDDKMGRGALDFEKGALVHAQGRGIEEVLENIGTDETGRIVGEFGVGTNPGARVCPVMLEAEKAFGTVHFAIGDSYGNGRNRSRHHYDCLVEKVTIQAKGKTIAKDGKFLI